jgi:type IV secretory pathway VirB10-like protein
MMPPPLPTTPRLSPGRLKGLAAIAGSLALGMVIMSLVQKQQVAQTPPEAPLPPIYEVSGEADALQRLQLKTSWAGEDRTPPAPPPKPPTPPTLPPPAPLFPPQGSQVASLAPPPAPALASPFLPPVSAAAPTTTPVQTGAPVQAAPPHKPAAKAADSEEWLFAEVKTAKRGTVGAKSAMPPGEGSAPRPGTGQSQLFPPAQWERPAKPERVIYSSQIMQCMLEQAIKTGQDGTIRCRLTETLYDKFGQLHPLLPLYSLILGNVSGASVKPGQTTVPIKVTKVELPDGTDLPLTGNMGGTDGISGVPASRIDNRYPEVVLSALLTAATAIGTRGITGSPSGFQPNLGQEFTADAAQSLSQSGQAIVKRSLSIDPVIWIDVHTPVTIQLDRNISLQSQPIIVHR